MLPDSWGDGWANVALGVTAGTLATAKRDIPILQATPAARRFVSMEPLLERVDICEELGIWWNQATGQWVRERDHGLHQIIVGGESGTGARPMHPEWAKSLRDRRMRESGPCQIRAGGCRVPLLS